MSASGLKYAEKRKNDKKVGTLKCHQRLLKHVNTKQLMDNKIKQIQFVLLKHIKQRFCDDLGRKEKYTLRHRSN